MTLIPFFCIFDTIADEGRGKIRHLMTDSLTAHFYSKNNLQRSCNLVTRLKAITF